MSFKSPKQVTGPTQNSCHMQGIVGVHGRRIMERDAVFGEVYFG